MRRPAYPDGGRGLPRVAYGDPAAGARALADMIPAAIAQAEAADLPEVVRRLSEALRLAETRAAETGGTGDARKDDAGE